MNKKSIKKIIVPLIFTATLVVTAIILRPGKTTKSNKRAEVNGLMLEQNVNYGTAKIVSYDKQNRYIKAAEDGYEIDGINNAIIPETVEIDGEQYKITEIGENAFSDSKMFKTLTIPGTVEKINSGAFTRCPNLTKVVISNPKTVIVSNAFDTATENSNLVFSYNGQEVSDLTELENKIIVGLNSSEVIKIGEVQWNNSKVEVQLSTEYEKYTIQYRVNGGDWNVGTTVSNLNLNDKVEARLTYGENSTAGYASYTVVDTDPVINNFYSYSTGTDFINVYYSVKDDIGIQNVEIYCDGSSVYSYSPNSKADSGSYIINSLSAGCSYEIKIVVTDYAGNKTEQTVTMYTDEVSDCGDCGSDCSGC